MKKVKKHSFLKRLLEGKEKSTITVYLILRLLVIICMVAQAIHHNWENVFLCLLTLVLFTVPTLIEKKLKIDFPSTLEIIVYLFIYSAEKLGEIQNFYGIFHTWDTMLHTLNGFLCAAVGFSLVDIINRNEKFKVHLSPLFLSLVAFCFSMTVGVMWEFFEFTADRYLLTDMQKDRVVDVVSSVSLNEENKNKTVVIDEIEKTIIFTENNESIVIDNGYLELGGIDTMKDLFVNFIGAVVFSIFGYLYVINREKYKGLEKVIPRLKRD
jgi:hypothetical protein